MTGTSVSTGETVDLSMYNTTGPINATYSNTLPTSPSPTCWLRNIPETCSDEQTHMIIDNQGVIINGVLYDASSDWSSPGTTPTPTAGGGGGSSGLGGTISVTTTTEVLTGLFTATSTPTPSGKKSLGVISLDPNIALLGVHLFVFWGLICLS